MDTVHEGAEELLGLIGESEKPEVEKNVDDIEQAWSLINSKWADRQKDLDEAMRRATHFQEQMMVIIGRILAKTVISNDERYVFGMTSYDN